MEILKLVLASITAYERDEIHTMSVDGRLERDDRLVRVQSFPHLLRDAKEAVVG
jgi:hypothetical protein